MDRMKRFWKIKGNKSPKPSLKPTSPGDSAGVSPRPSGFRAELGAGSEGGCRRYQLLEDCLDLTGSLDERINIGPQIAFQARKDENQELPASEASTSSIAIGVTGYGDEPSERSWSLRLGSMFIQTYFSLPISRGH